MTPRFSSRTAFFLALAFCVAALGTALWMQHGLGLKPCSLCILQRYALILCALVALAAALHHPGATGLRIYSALLTLSALAGMGLSARHILLQRDPQPVGLGGCGADADYLLQNLPLSESLPALFRGEGDCSQIEWTFHGVTIPEMSLFGFLFVAMIAVIAWDAAARRR